MDIARVTITLLDVQPPVRRVVEVPIALTLAELHATIQAAMGWHNSHLYEFHDGSRVFGSSSPGLCELDHRVGSATKTLLADLLTGTKRRIGYVYDLGDDWRHRLDITRVGEAVAGVVYPRLIKAEGRCPPEDVGGWPGFGRFLEAINDPAHPDHAELHDWYGGAFDPNDPDQPALINNLAKIAGRLARKKSGRKSKACGSTSQPGFRRGPLRAAQAASLRE
jgi:Plasmid pRiA4b ORF-3-like protein